MLRNNTISVTAELKVQETLFSSAVCSHGICIPQQDKYLIFFISNWGSEWKCLCMQDREKPHFGYCLRSGIHRFQLLFPWGFKYLFTKESYSPVFCKCKCAVRKTLEFKGYLSTASKNIQEYKKRDFINIWNVFYILTFLRHTSLNSKSEWQCLVLLIA